MPLLRPDKGDTFRDLFRQGLEEWVKSGNGYLTILELIERWDRANEFAFYRWLADHTFECGDCSVVFEPITEHVTPESSVLCRPCAQ